MVIEDPNPLLDLTTKAKPQVIKTISSPHSSFREDRNSGTLATNIEKPAPERQETVVIRRGTREDTVIERVR